MNAINKGSAVFVCTGYSDSQLQLHGFAGRVVDIRGESYRVRDGRGEVTTCAPGELQPLSEQQMARLPGVAPITA